MAIRFWDAPDGRRYPCTFIGDFMAGVMTAVYLERRSHEVQQRMARYLRGDNAAS